MTTYYRDYFFMFADRDIPDAYERTLPEVFPDFAPGNFTFDDESQSWVWTTFNTWQWDLNWRNPEVFFEFADIICWLANLGVECVRLDAIAFIFKRLGTNCQNQPEVHAITQALRAVARIAAPALIFKAEAIVGPTDLPPYLGVGKHAGRVSDLAYQNSLMVQIWSALASKDTRLFCAALNRFPAKPPTTVWGTYLRCHDDIGWAIDDGDAASVGLNGFEHRRFLADFYAGSYPDERRARVWSSRRTCRPVTDGSAAARRRWSGSRPPWAAATRRTSTWPSGGCCWRTRSCSVSVVCRCCTWVTRSPCATSTTSSTTRPTPTTTAGCTGRRCTGRSAERRHVEGTVEHRVWHGLRHSCRGPVGLPSMDASVESEVMDPVNPAVLVLQRRASTQTLVGVYNMTPDVQKLPRWVVSLGNWSRDALTDETPLTDGEIVLQPYQARWLVQSA